MHTLFTTCIYTLVLIIWRRMGYVLIKEYLKLLNMLYDITWVGLVYT